MMLDTHGTSTLGTACKCGCVRFVTLSPLAYALRVLVLWVEGRPVPLNAPDDCSGVVLCSLCGAVQGWVA